MSRLAIGYLQGCVRALAPGAHCLKEALRWAPGGGGLRTLEGSPHLPLVTEPGVPPSGSLSLVQT